MSEPILRIVPILNNVAYLPSQYINYLQNEPNPFVAQFPCTAMIPLLYGAIAGAVIQDGGAVRRRVCLLDRRTMQIIRKTWAHAESGVYSFLFLDLTKKYAILCDDYTQEKNAVISDWQLAT